MPEPALFDVAVVGSGPAGCSAAHALARSGARVLIIEKASLPRYKTCGGGLVQRARKLLPDGLSVPVEREFFSAELNFVQRRRRFVANRATPIISMTMRSELDQTLALEAERAGARLLTLCNLSAVRVRPECVELQTSSGCFRARFVVAADGATSSVAKQAGWPVMTRLVPALECEVFVKESDFDRLKNTARFDFELLPSGYAWVFPKKEHLSIGVLSMRRGPVHLPAAIATYLELLGIKNPVKVERHGYLIPVKPRDGGLARGRILLVGDAAGLVDPVTAEGITGAIRSGQLAAQSLIENAFDPSRAAQVYQSLLERHILTELNSARMLAWILYQRPRLAGWLLQAHGQRLSELVTDVVTGQKTCRELLRKPANYLRLLSGLCAAPKSLQRVP